MKRCWKIWMVLVGVMMLATVSALAERLSTPSDVCDHPEWVWGHDETHCWEYCAVCGEVMYKREHVSECFSPNECSNCGATDVTIRKDNIRHGADVRWDYDDACHWRVCLTCGEAYEHDEQEHYAMCNNLDACAKCGAPYHGDQIKHTAIEGRTDANYHWRVCTACGEIAGEKQAHWAYCGETECGWCETPFTGTVWHVFDNKVDGYDKEYHWSVCLECGKSIKEKHYSLITYWDEEDYRGICTACGQTFTVTEDSITSINTSSSGGTSSASLSATLLTGNAETVMGLYPYEDGLPRAIVSAPKTGKATLRATATTGGKALMQLVDGSVVIVLGESGKFTEVEFNGVKGYILTSALETLDIEQLPLGEGMLTYPSTGGRGTTTVNVRSEASSRARKIDAWPTGTVVMIWSVSEDGQWYEIEYESVRVYVSREFLTVTQIYDYTIEETAEAQETAQEA